MPFRTVGRTGPGMRQIVAFGISQRERVILGEIWGAPMIQKGTLRRSCAKVREPSELQFVVVRGVGRGIGVLRYTSCN